MRTEVARFLGFANFAPLNFSTRLIQLRLAVGTKPISLQVYLLHISRRAHYAFEMTTMVKAKRMSELMNDLLS